MTTSTGSSDATLAAILAAGLSVLGVTPALAHTPITTRYRFDTDVRPVLEKRCVRCHSPGGPTPMSLRTYKETRPWAESIKEQLLDRSMPPLYVEHVGMPVRNGSPLTARELDILIDWASGGAPEGSPPARSTSDTEDGETSGPANAAEAAVGETEPSREPPEPGGEWKVSEFSDFVSPDGRAVKELQVTHRTTLAAAAYLTGWRLESDPRWLRGAVLWVEGTPAGGRDGSTVESAVFLGSWVAGDEPFLFPRGAGFEIPSGSTIRVDARYKRTWLQRSKQLEPRTRLELRLSRNPPPRAVLSLAVTRDGLRQDRVGASQGANATALAFFPVDPAGGKLVLEVEAAPRVLLELYRATEEWPITYRFRSPVSVTGRLVWSSDGQLAGAAVDGYAICVTDR